MAYLPPFQKAQEQEIGQKQAYICKMAHLPPLQMARSKIISLKNFGEYDLP